MDTFRTEMVNPLESDMHSALSKAFGHVADHALSNRTNDACWAWPSGSLANNPGGSPLSFTQVEWRWENGTLRVVVDRVTS